MLDSRILIGVWASVVATGAQMGVGYWQDHRGAKPEVAAAHATTSVRKLQPLTVPILSNGQVQGYVLARLSLEVDEKSAKAAELAPDPFVLDEAFRYL